MDSRDAALKRYYRSIRSYLPSSPKLKRKILAEIETNIIAYLQENPDADFATIEARFGASEQIASAYVDELGTPELLKKLHIRKRVLTITIGAITIILILWLSVVGWAAITEHYHSNGTVTNSGAVEITP